MRRTRLVTNPVSQKFHQPFLVDIIKETFDIGFNNPVDAASTPLRGSAPCSAS